MYEINLAFPTHIYRTEAVQFVEEVSSVTDPLFALPSARKSDAVGIPLVQTENFFNAPRAARFCHFVGYRCWKILEEQGYLMEDMHVHFSEMWAQEYHRHSYMEPHVHNKGSVLCGFFFLEVPENGPKMAFFDPRPGKVQSGFDLKLSEKPLYAHDRVEMPVNTGDLIITNSWLAHGFSPNMSDKPCKLVHFNAVLNYVPSDKGPTVEVV